MVLKVTDECINYDVCESEYPNSVISQGLDGFEIKPSKYSEYRGYFDES